MVSTLLLGVARMRGRYYYFCSGGSIFTVSTVGRKGRMGKYMKKAKSVKNMEVSQSSLLGVRTRARALELEKQTSESIRKHSLTSSPTATKSRKSSQSLGIPSNNEPHYMQLRSRRLEKVARHCEVDAGDGQNQFELEFGGRSADQNPVALLPCSSRPHVDLCMLNEELLDMPARNSCSSRPDFVSVGVSSATAPYIEDASLSRVTSPAQSSLQISNNVNPVVTSTLTIQGRGASRIVTRHQQQELDSKLSADAKVEMDIERGSPEATRPTGNVKREREVGPCFGESPMIAGPSGRERQQGPNTRSQKCECPLDNLTLKAEVPGSTSRTRVSAQMRSSSAPPLSRSTEAPFSAEIEAFFASAEQNERRRFIDRYNFDPLTEKPLKGRYLWLKE